MTKFVELEAALARLAEQDERYAGWNPLPVSEEELRAFEERHGISLAESHRSWLLHFGQSPICPALVGSRTTDLEQSTTHFIYEDFAGRLATEFAYSGTEAIALEWDEVADAPVDEAPLRGAMCLGYAGCDELWVVVVSGPEKGKVWGFVPGLDKELHPTGLSVPQWHLRRVEHALESLARSQRQRRE